MVRPPSKQEERRELKKGPWTPEEDQKLLEYLNKNGVSNWKSLPHLAGLNRCGKSCRLRWINYLRPDIKRGNFSQEEEDTIIQLHSKLGNRWSAIANNLVGRTDNEIKNHWNTHLRKKLLSKGIDPVTHEPRTDLSSFSSLLSSTNGSTTDLISALTLQSDLAKLQLVHSLIQVLSNLNNPSAFALGGSPDFEPNKIPGSSSLLGGPAGGVNEIKSASPIDCGAINFGDFYAPTGPISSVLNEPHGLEDGTSDHFSISESTDLSNFSGACELDSWTFDHNPMSPNDHHHLFVGGYAEQDPISSSAWGFSDL